MFVKVDGKAVAAGVLVVVGILAVLFPERSLEIVTGTRETVANFVSPGFLYPAVSGVTA